MLPLVAIVGLALLWFRPLYGFAVTFAVCLFLYALLAGALPGLALHPEILRNPSFIVAFFAGFAVAAGGVSVAFLAVGSSIVALRKWMKANKAKRDDATVEAQVARARADTSP
jgi:hypothetical protein